MSAKTKVTLHDLSISNFDHALDVEGIKGGALRDWVRRVVDYFTGGEFREEIRSWSTSRNYWFR